jgi:membrane protein required for colicin V production
VTTPDLVIVAVFGLSMLIGLMRGFVVEVMSIVVWFLAVGLAYWFGPALAVRFSGAPELSAARILLGYGGVFVGSLLAGAVLIYFLKKLVTGTGLTGTDRLFGMLFGAVRGLVLVVIGLLVLGLTNFPLDPWWNDSRGIAMFQPMAERARAWLPASVVKHVRFEAPPAAAPSTPAPAAGAAAPAIGAPQVELEPASEPAPPTNPTP